VREYFSEIGKVKSVVFKDVPQTFRNARKKEKCDIDALKASLAKRTRANLQVPNFFLAVEGKKAVKTSYSSGKTHAKLEENSCEVKASHSSKPGRRMMSSSWYEPSRGRCQTRSR